MALFSLFRGAVLEENIQVQVGQTITEGQVIAKVGMTGYTFRPHLHFQVFIYTGTNFWIDFDTVSVQDFRKTTYG